MAGRQTSRQILLCFANLQHDGKNNQLPSVVDIKHPMVFGRTTCPYFRHPSISRRHFLIEPAIGDALQLKALGMHSLVVERQQRGQPSHWILLRILQKGETITLQHGMRFCVEALADVAMCYVWNATTIEALRSHLLASHSTMKSTTTSLSDCFDSKHYGSTTLARVSSQSPIPPCTPISYGSFNTPNNCGQSSSPLVMTSHGNPVTDWKHHTDCTMTSPAIDKALETNRHRNTGASNPKHDISCLQQCVRQSLEGCSTSFGTDMLTDICTPSGGVKAQLGSKARSHSCIVAEPEMSQPSPPATPEQVQTLDSTYDDPGMPNTMQSVKRRRLWECTPRLGAGQDASQHETPDKAQPQHTNSNSGSQYSGSSVQDKDNFQQCSIEAHTDYSGIDKQVESSAPGTSRTDVSCSIDGVVDATTVQSQLLLSTPPIQDVMTLADSQMDMEVDTSLSGTAESNDFLANCSDDCPVTNVRRILADLCISGDAEAAIVPATVILKPATTGHIESCHEMVTDDLVRSAVGVVARQDAPFGLTASSLSIPSEYNQGRLGVRLSQLVKGGPMQLVVAMSFPVALDNMVAMCPDLLQAQQLVLVHELQDREINLRQQAHKLGISGKTHIHRPRIPWPYNEWGCQHAKGFLIQYEAGLRVVVMSANLLSALDCDALTQSIWWQDFPLKDHESPATSDFEENMANFVHSWRLHSKVECQVIDMLHRYDMSSARAALVASVPGLHMGADMHKYGHLRVRQVLQKVPLPEGDHWHDSSSFVLQGTSLGSLNDVWIRQQLVSSFAATAAPTAGTAKPKAQGGRTVVVKQKQRSAAVKKREAARRRMTAVGANGRAVDRSRVFFLWPTSEEIHHAAARYYQGRICGLAGEYSYIRRPCLAPYMARYNGQATGRGHVVPHIKSYCRYSGQQVAWVMTGSHNCSKAAWGKLSMRKQDGQMKYEIWNYELSVLAAPFFEMAYRNHRHYGFDCLSTTQPSSSPQPSSQRVEFWSIHQCLQDHLTKQQRQGCHLPQQGSPCMEAVTRLPVHLPYHLPPERYHIGIDEPWTCDMLQEAPDIAGHGPHLGQEEQRIAKEQGYINIGLHTDHKSLPTAAMRQQDSKHTAVRPGACDVKTDDNDDMMLPGCQGGDTCTDDYDRDSDLIGAGSCDIEDQGAENVTSARIDKGVEVIVLT